MRTYNSYNTADSILYHTDNYNRLVADIKRTEMLSKDEEETLMVEYFTTANEERKVEIRNTIVTANSRFFVKLAHYYGGSNGEKVCDYFSIIMEGVLHCFAMFDLSKGFRFITFAKEWARNAVSQYKRDKQALVYNGKENECKKAVAYSNRIFVAEGRTPSADEVLAYLNDLISKENKVRKAEGKKERKLNSLADLVSFKQSSLETPMGEDGTLESVGEFATATASEIICKAKEDTDYTTAIVRRCMLCLTDKERQVISLAYGISLDGRNIRAISDLRIAEALHYTKERVRQIRKGAESKMRDFAVRHKMLA